MAGGDRRRLTPKEKVRSVGVPSKGSPRASNPADPSVPVKETIFLVEDDGAVRSMARSVLASQGYQVLEAPNGTEALLQASLYQAPLHLLVTDVVMPGMNGPQLAQAVKESHPEIKVLFLSGFTDEALAAHGLLDIGPPFLKKPYAPDELTQKVREVLDAPGQP
jgi:two-component system, cell cycle sensor histidine kinase and response regulator CckA